MEQAPQHENSELKKIDVSELRRIRRLLERESDMGPGDSKEELQKKNSYY